MLPIIESEACCHLWKVKEPLRLESEHRITLKLLCLTEVLAFFGQIIFSPLLRLGIYHTCVYQSHVPITLSELEFGLSLRSVRGRLRFRPSRQPSHVSAKLSAYVKVCGLAAQPVDAMDGVVRVKDGCQAAPCDTGVP